MSHIKTHVKKGDRVQVISGAFRGAQGTVTQVIPAKHRVLIEGVRMIKKAVRPSQDRPNGGIIEKEGPIHISNVKLVEEVKPAKETKKKVAKKK
jgi:large subunit ribosomal protein L24